MEMEDAKNWTKDQIQAATLHLSDLDTMTRSPGSQVTTAGTILWASVDTLSLTSDKFDEGIKKVTKLKTIIHERDLKFNGIFRRLGQWSSTHR